MKSLVILAAGMWSRYGWGGLKQIDQFWPNGEKIMDYSIYDAINAWFDKIIFVIREEFSDTFETQIIHPLRKSNPSTIFVTVFQKMESLIPAWFDVSHREKPRGTAHALLVAKNEIDGPFTVINADDRYGPNAFVKISNYFDTKLSSKGLCMVGYILENTISPHGTVNRWVCKVHNGRLHSIHERLKIAATWDDTTATDEEGNVFDLESIVSMNFRWFHKEHIEVIELQFQEFIKEYWMLSKKEFFIPVVVESLIESGYYCDVITTTDPWCGVSYKEDKPFVQKTIQKAIDDGLYPKQWLWSTVS